MCYRESPAVGLKAQHIVFALFLLPSKAVLSGALCKSCRVPRQRMYRSSLHVTDFKNACMAEG